MQGILLILIAVLAVTLYKLLSGQKTTYTYIRTTKKEFTNDNTEFFSTINENGFITIDKNMVIVEEEEYSINDEKDNPAEARLNIINGRLINVVVKLIDGEKTYFLDPENNFFNMRMPSSNINSVSKLVAI